MKIFAPPKNCQLQKGKALANKQHPSLWLSTYLHTLGVNGHRWGRAAVGWWCYRGAKWEMDAIITSSESQSASTYSGSSSGSWQSEWVPRFRLTKSTATYSMAIWQHIQCAPRTMMAMEMFGCAKTAEKTRHIKQDLCKLLSGRINIALVGNFFSSRLLD